MTSGMVLDNMPPCLFFRKNIELASQIIRKILSPINTVIRLKKQTNFITATTVLISWSDVSLRFFDEYVSTGNIITLSLVYICYVSILPRVKCNYKGILVALMGSVLSLLLSFCCYDPRYRLSVSNELGLESLIST